MEGLDQHLDRGTRGLGSRAVLSVEVRVTPRATRDEIVGMRDGILSVRVTAAPVDDAANQAVLRLIAKRAGVPRSRVTLASGARGRRKRIEIAGAGPELLERLTQ